MSCKKIIILFVIICGSGVAVGQGKLSKQELIQKVKAGNYPEVYESLEANHQKFPKDPDYLFYTGVCRVALQTNINGAIELLKESTENTSFKESWFYLGRAYMLNYQFTEAQEAFGRFNDKASKDEKEKVQLSMYRAMCRNAVDLCTKSKKVSLVKVDTVSETNLISFLNKQKIKGKFSLVEQPGKLSSKVRQELNFSDGAFVFQAKLPFGKKHKDIFFSEEDAIELSKLKALTGINTPFEEAFVYYDETVPALYFSSQGHNSAGGFDIFKSYYDKPSKKWSKPVNIGFPLNTPYDEVAYLTIPGTSRSILASKRNSLPGKLLVYTLENIEEATEETIALANAKELAGFNTLKPVASKPAAKEKPTVNKRNEVPEELRNEQAYKTLIHQALNLQIRSDSIRRIGDEKKEQLISAKTEADKKRLWQEIKTIDAKADEVQEKADILYRKARALEAEKQEQVNTKELAQKAFTTKTAGTAENSSAQNTKETPANGTSIHEVQYRIQVGVFSKLQPATKFKGFSNVHHENVNGTAHKYYVGLYKKVSDAEKALIKAKDAGFRDAYIIGFYNGKVVPLSRARELELTLQKQ